MLRNLKIHYAHYQHTRHGDPDEPLSDEELVDKFNELVEPRVGSKRTQALSRVILNESGILVREIANLWA